MKNIFCLLLVGLFCQYANAQNQFTAIIIDKHTEETLIGVNVHVEELEIGAASDVDGHVHIDNIPDGTYTIHISYIGFEEQELSYTFPIAAKELIITLEPHTEALATFTTTTTRSSRQIKDIPTRIEAINSEELAEKAVMNSANISILLRESTGIQVQQTSASSANQSIRIQGLDGRYTQILKDGFPIFGGFSSGLSIMQIPPLDLAQVEVVKGSSSTLYGGGAIAGLVNLISKTPEHDPELTLMYSQTHALGSTLNGFYAQEFGKLGLSLYTSGHYQKAYDNNSDDFSDLPQTKSISINPSFFYNFNNKSKLRISLNTGFEDRWGGDLTLIENKGATDNHQYSERNLSQRIANQIRFDHQISDHQTLTLRNSVNYFDRIIELPDFSFKGKQLASFSEAAYSSRHTKMEWVLGTNLWTDRFDERDVATERDYSNTILGLFAQNTFTVTSIFSTETGLRIDYNKDYGVFVLPRLNLLLNLNHHWTMRLGGGMGYKTPTLFTETAEGLAYQSILPLNTNDLSAETSIGGNFDINYKTILWDKVSFSVNQLFFYTYLKQPIILSTNENQSLFFENSAGLADSKGFETNIKFSYDDFKLFLNYALIDAQLKYNNTRIPKPLTPKHNIGGVLMYENATWRIGYEAYYTGQQYLSNGDSTKDYWIMGFMLLRTIKNTDFYINFENFTDTRQSRYQAMFNDEHTNPNFSEIWAPTDGFIFTAGLKVHLFGKEEHHH